MSNQRGSYKKSQGASGKRGVDYQVNILALFALRGLSIEKWKLSTELENVHEGFNDVVFETENGNFLMQCKHKDTKQNITWQDLSRKREEISKDKGDFALLKYYDSFLKVKDEFNIELLIFCSNIGPKMSEDLFEEVTISSNPPFQRVKNFYRLNNGGTENGKLFLSSSSTDAETISEFCDKLRIYHITDSELNKSITDELELAQKNFKFELDKQHFMKNMNDWYLEKKAKPLTKSHVKALLYESSSQKYSMVLNSYKIHFKKYYTIAGNRVMNIIKGKTDFLNILKVHRSLQNICIESKLLFIDPRDDISVILNMMESFELPRFEILFISLYGFDKSDMEELCQEINAILTNFLYKKAIIISKESIQVHFSSHQTDTVEDEIKFSDLAQCSQDKLLNKSVKFQDKVLSLKDLMKNATDDINNIIDQLTIIDLILDKKFEIGRAIKDLGDIQRYYMTRKFRFKTEEGFTEFDEQEINHFIEKPGKFVLISDGAGMGKTTILTQLGSLLKKNEMTRYRFLVRIDLNRFTSIFKQFQKAKKTSIDLEEILASKHEDYSKNGFERNVFRMTSKIILMVDAVDEISPTYTSLVENFLLQTSKRDNIFKIFVTTRPHLSMNLEMLLSTKSYRLLPYSQRQQIEFLTKYWEKGLDIGSSEAQSRCRTYAETLIDRIGKAIGNTSWNFIGIPLQTRMIAEIFQGSDEKEYYWVCCKDFLISANEQLDLPDKLNITKLFDMFVEKKGEIFIDDKCNTRGNPATEEIVSKHYADAINEHQKLAAQLLFRDEECSLLTIFGYVNNTSKETLIKMGMIQETGNELLFVHQTFAEYFAAQLLWIQLNDMEYSRDFLLFLLGYVFVESEFEVIRAFFESILANEFDELRGDILGICGSAVDSISWSNTKNVNLLGREGRQQILKLMLEKSENSKDLFYNDTDSTWKGMVLRLWLRIRKREKLLNIVDKTSGRTVLSEAINFPEIVRFLLDKGGNFDQRDRDGRTILNYATEKGNFELVKDIVGRGANVNNVDNGGQTPLIWSVDQNSIEIFHFLLENGADVNAGADEKSPLNIAVIKQNFQMVQELIKRGANIAKKHDDGVTCLHWAAFMGSEEILQLLLAEGANIDEQNDYGETVAHYAVEKVHLACLKMLIARGANVCLKNKKGQNILEFAKSFGQHDIVGLYEIVDFLSTDERLKADG